MSGGVREELSDGELADLVERVFAPREGERRIAVLCDLPDEALPDHRRWRQRRRLAAEWTVRLRRLRPRLGLEPRLVAYRNVRQNNAELPPSAWLADPLRPPQEARDLDPARAVPFERVFAEHPLLLAPTELSATAPLKLAARRHGLRAATMPGFCAEMIPALRLDYREIDRRVRWLAAQLDDAEGAELRLAAAGRDCALHLDLRHRQGHASGARMTAPGEAGNLPSGESYIVPYEGEVEGDPSRSCGELPVELEGEVVLYRIEGNRAVEVLSAGPVSRREADLLGREPGYANLAELGLGVLADFGLEPIGEILLDEKLGLHIAFGRSDHFGGQTGPESFTSPQAVIHIDRIYLPQIQSQIRVRALDLLLDGKAPLALIRDDRYVTTFGDRPR